MYAREEFLEEVKTDFNEIKAAKKVWVYGYSNLGRNVLNKLHSIWPEKMAGIIVTGKNQRSLKSDKKIVEIEKADINDSVILITTNPLFHAGIIKKLKEKQANCIVYI